MKASIVVCCGVLFAAGAQAQYRVANPAKYHCVGGDLSGSGGAAAAVSTSDVIMSPDGTFLCDLGQSGGDNVKLGSRSALVADLANKVAALESALAALQASHNALRSELDAWKKDTIDATLARIDTLPFATQPSVIKAIAPLTAELLKTDAEFLQALKASVPK